MFANTFSNEEMTKIKIVDLDKFNKFAIHDFFSWNHLGFQKLVWSCYFLKFKIWIIQNLSNKKLTKIINVDADEFEKLGIYGFSIWDHLGVSKTGLKSFRASNTRV